MLAAAPILILGSSQATGQCQVHVLLLLYDILLLLELSGLS